MTKLKKQITLKRFNSSLEEAKKRAENYCKSCKCICVNLVITDDIITFVAYSNISYEQLVNQLVAEKYTIQDELAIQRKAYNGLTDEFLIYNAYVEECKLQAKAFIEEREKALNE